MTLSKKAQQLAETYEGLWLDARENVAAEIPANIQGDARENRIFAGAVVEADYHAEAAHVSVEGFHAFLVARFGFSTWHELRDHCATFLGWEA